MVCSFSLTKRNMMWFNLTDRFLQLWGGIIVDFLFNSCIQASFFFFSKPACKSGKCLRHSLICRQDMTSVHLWVQGSSVSGVSRSLVGSECQVSTKWQSHHKMQVTIPVQESVRFGFTAQQQKTPEVLSIHYCPIVLRTTWRK